MEDGKFRIERWNGEYGNGAGFIIRDLESGKTCEFHPAHRQEYVWSEQDLTQQDVYNRNPWREFGDSPEDGVIDDMESLIF